MFWIAAEDHDFAEVAKAEFISRDCQLNKVHVSTACIAKANRLAMSSPMNNEYGSRSAI